MFYKWEPKLSLIHNTFLHEMSIAPAGVRGHAKKAVNSFVKLLQEELCLDFDQKRVPETVEFLKRSLVVINSHLPENEPLRLAIKIPLDPPRIEIRFIKSEHTLEGRLAFIADHCPAEEAGQCLAIVYLSKMPQTKH